MDFAAALDSVEGADGITNLANITHLLSVNLAIGMNLPSVIISFIGKCRRIISSYSL